MKRSTLILIIGILVMAIGFAFNTSYEEAKASGYEVSATITRIETYTSNDVGMDDTYIAYGKYEVDGKTYSDRRLGSCSEDTVAGDTMKIVVDPNDPEDQMNEGGILGVLGMVVICYALYQKYKERKAAKEQA